jgi:hypothetical protein
MSEAISWLLLLVGAANAVLLVFILFRLPRKREDSDTLYVKNSAQDGRKQVERQGNHVMKSQSISGMQMRHCRIP